MYTNTSCTLYLKSEKYAKTYIEKCFLTHRKIASYEKDGLSYPESAFVMCEIPEGKVFTEGKDFLVEGQTNLTIDGSSEQAFSQSMKTLKDTYDVFTIMVADEKSYGSASMRHLEISCK